MQVSELYCASRGSKLIEARNITATPTIMERLDKQSGTALLDIIGRMMNLGYNPHGDTVAAVPTRKGIRFIIHDFDDFVISESFLKDQSNIQQLDRMHYALRNWAGRLKLTPAQLCEELAKRVSHPVSIKALQALDNFV